ncbi:MAG: phosphatidylserine decarboxylase, partial [Gammaproteobacteria bacterium]
MFIAREVRIVVVILVLLAITAKVYLGWLPALAVLVLVLPVVFVFREPACQVPSSPLAVVSSANGVVTSVEMVTDPWLERPAKRCRIKMSFWDVHTLRSPIEGKVKNQWAAASDEPGIKRRYSYWIQTDEGDDVVLSVATGVAGHFTTIKLRCGERTGQGQPCGHLYVAGLIDVLMPENTRVDLKPGDRV